MNNKRKVIRTCLHQPFEFNIRTLDNLKSTQLFILVKSLSNQENIKIGLGMRTCIRQIRAEQQILCVIIIFDQQIKELMIQFATVLWKYKFEPIIAKEESRNQFKSLFKTAKRINCIFLYCKQKISEEQYQELKIQFNQFKEDSKFEIPLIFKEELTLKPVQLINHVIQVQTIPKQQQQKKVKIQQSESQQINQKKKQQNKKFNQEQQNLHQKSEIIDQDQKIEVEENVEQIDQQLNETQEPKNQDVL